MLFMETFMQHLETLIKAIPITFMALFPVINPLGTAIIIHGITGNLDQKARMRFSRKIAFNSVLLLITLLLGGGYILSFFGISVPVIQLAGGIVLASMGWKMLDKDDQEGDKKSGKTIAEAGVDLGNKVFYPFTFPLTIGPGVVAVALTLSAHTKGKTISATLLSQIGASIAIVAIGIALYVILGYADVLMRKLGSSGTAAIMHLSAFIVVCIGAQITWSGIHTLIAMLPR
jgi:multiple antibiotic resistance protein